MLAASTFRHEGREFRAWSTVAGDCRPAMLVALVRSAIEQLGGEVGVDHQEAARWLTDEVGRTSARTVGRLYSRLCGRRGSHPTPVRQPVALQPAGRPARHGGRHQQPTTRAACIPTNIPCAGQRATRGPSDRFSERARERCPEEPWCGS